MRQVITGDLIVKGFSMEVEVDENAVIQITLEQALRAFLDFEGVSYERVYGIDCEDFLKQLQKANALDWCTLNNKCYLTKVHDRLLGIPMIDVPMMLKRYEVEKGGKNK